MPVIPRYQRQVQQGGFDASSAARFTPQVPAGGLGGAQARDLGQLAGGIMQAAQTAGGIMLQRQDEINRVKVRSALTQARLESSGVTTGFMNREGMDALEVQKEASKQFTDLRSKYLEQFDNDWQKRTFGMLFDEQTAGDIERLGKHQAAELKKATTITRMNENQGFLAEAEPRAFDEHTLSTLQEGGRQNVRAEFGAYGDAAVKTELRKWDTQFHQRVIATRMAKDPKGAQDYFKKVRKQMTTEVSLKVAESLEAAIPEWEGQAAGDEMFERHGLQGYGEAWAELEGKPMDRKTRLSAINRLAWRFRVEKQHKDMRDASELEGMYRSSQNLSHAERMSLLRGMGLEPETFRQAAEAEKLAHTEMGKQAGEMLFNKLRVESVLDPEGFQNQPLAQYIPLVNFDRYAQLQQMQDRIRSGQQSEEDALIKDAMTLWDNYYKLPAYPTSASGREAYKEALLDRDYKRGVAVQQLTQKYNEMKVTTGKDVLSDTEMRNRLVRSVLDKKVPSETVLPIGALLPLPGAITKAPKFIYLSSGKADLTETTWRDLGRIGITSKDWKYDEGSDRIVTRNKDAMITRLMLLGWNQEDLAKIDANPPDAMRVNLVGGDVYFIRKGEIYRMR